MLDHIFITVSDTERSIDFYERVLPLLGITNRHDYDGSNGPSGHPDLKGFGANGRVFFWLRPGTPYPQAVHVGFVADSKLWSFRLMQRQLRQAQQGSIRLVLSCTMTRAITPPR